MLKIIKTEIDNLKQSKTTEVGNFPEDQAINFIRDKYTEFTNDILNDHLKKCMAITEREELNLNKTYNDIESIQTFNSKIISLYITRKTSKKVFKTYYNKITETFFHIAYEIKKIKES